MTLARELAQDLKRRGSSIGKPALITLKIDELALESIVAAKLEEFHRTMKVRLESVEYALDTSPKWRDENHKPMTQHEALMMVRCVLAMLSEEE